MLHEALDGAALPGRVATFEQQHVLAPCPRDPRLGLRNSTCRRYLCSSYSSRGIRSSWGSFPSTCRSCGPRRRSRWGRRRSPRQRCGLVPQLVDVLMLILGHGPRLARVAAPGRVSDDPCRWRVTDHRRAMPHRARTTGTAMATCETSAEWSCSGDRCLPTRRRVPDQHRPRCGVCSPRRVYPPSVRIATID